MDRLACLLFPLATFTITAQKAVYIPAYLLDTNTPDGQQFTWDKTRESDNFILIWGDSAGADPTQAQDPVLRFDPDAVLDTMEWIYDRFVELDFAWDTLGTSLHQYKVPVVMLNTFGPSGATGWAFGGDVDGVIGAFWVHPLGIRDGGVAAHEFAHSLQAQNNIDYRRIHGLGLSWLNAGIFWETHANFMRNLLYPRSVSAWGMDVYHVETWGDWKNTYENYPLLLALMAEDGIGIINRLWRESESEEYPLQAYKRLLDIDQDAFNDKLFRYARRMATYDFPDRDLGTYFRQYRNGDLMYHLPTVQAVYTILRQDSFMPGHFSVPVPLAPEEYAYNVIPIYPDPDSCAVIIKFKGHAEANPHAGWRYGFVAADADDIVTRYSETYALAEDEVGFSLEPGEEKMYFVVMGAPDVITTNPSNDTWHGYPKHFRYPYDLHISGGLPEGYQPAGEFRVQLKNNGHLHVNGGGWVDNAVLVDASVFVAPHALVLGQSTLTGEVRLEHTAVVRDAFLGDQVIVSDNSFVVGGMLSDSARVRDQAFVENCTLWDQALVGMRAKVSNYRLHGDIEVGGDVVVYNASGDCDNGVYYRMTNYYADNLLECDGRTALHPDNADVNEPVTPFPGIGLVPSCDCSRYPDCDIASRDEDPLSMDEFRVFPNPVSGEVFFDLYRYEGQALDLRLYDALGIRILAKSIPGGGIFREDLAALPAGMYTARLSSGGRPVATGRIVLHR